MSDLTPKQARFVAEYLTDLNATQAAIRAGYSEHTAKSIGQENLTKPDIMAAIAAGQKTLANRLEITQDWVLENLKTITERCMQASPVLDRKGNQVMTENAEGDLVPAYVFNAAGATRAVELLGKHIGMFTDRTEVTGKDGAAIFTLAIGPNAKVD
ncbi:terminase small subunit [Zavarzinella formosa]|uniref:terminase small subunit n=1 Tax=Zavarzinella formosa TaxID=360055 RepID=UPI0002F73228|nr:terminase small subunit [Zavarzinella formosa]